MAAPHPFLRPSALARSCDPILPLSALRRYSSHPSPLRTRFALARSLASPAANVLQARKSSPPFPLLPPSVIPRRFLPAAPPLAFAHPHAHSLSHSPLLPSS